MFYDIEAQFFPVLRGPGLSDRINVTHKALAVARRADLGLLKTT